LAEDPGGLYQVEVRAPLMERAAKPSIGTDPPFYLLGAAGGLLMFVRLLVPALWQG
jgi:hypothetical protein